MSLLYNFSAKTLSGQDITFDQYAGKVILIVNTASECGFTPQFKGLEELYQKYGKKGLVILGFPCDQFGHQEPGSDKEIAAGCVINFGVTFQMFSKIKVNGKNTHPIYEHLKSEQKGVLGKRINWNFTKFLIDRQGNVTKRIASKTPPEKMESDIEKLLSKP